jgi:hypothetical protein
MIKLNKKFYIFCPLLVTGGPEALHQSSMPIIPIPDLD